MMTGAVFSEDNPEAVYHVALLDDDGNEVVRVRADRPCDREGVPGDRGFGLPLPTYWAGEKSEGPIRIKVVETGHVFPDSEKPFKASNWLIQLNTLSESRMAERHVQEGMKRLAEVREDDGPFFLATTHEMTRTGAPIIVLEILRYIGNRLGYKPIVLAVSDADDLEDEFAECSACIVKGISELGMTEKVVDELERHLVRLGTRSAVVNSLCSYPMAPLLSRLRTGGTRIVSLIHEYPDDFLAEWIAPLFRASGEVVFPSADVLGAYQKAELTGAAFTDTRFTIHPQGCYMLENLKRSSVEPVALDPTVLSRLEAIRQAGPIVFACGTADLRKGFDWFCNLAGAYQVRYGRDDSTQFVWVGKPINPRTYDSCMRDTRVLEVEHRFHYFQGQPDVTAFYEAADVFMLCSRLDPFPSVVQESFLYGVPVVGFDRGQGTSQMIEDHGFGTIVPYLDTVATVEAIHQLIHDDTARERVRKHGTRFLERALPYAEYSRSIAHKAGLPDQANAASTEALGETRKTSVPPVIITGFRQSGASFLAKWCDSIGIEMGSQDDVVGSAAGTDERFEDLSFVHFHYDAMASAFADFMYRHGEGRSTYLLPAEGQDWSYLTGYAERLAHQRIRSEPWGWKDPRTILFAKVWQSVFPDAILVMPLRHPVAIFDSIVRRESDKPSLEDPFFFIDAYVVYHRPLIEVARDAEHFRVVSMPPEEGAMVELGAIFESVYGSESIDLSRAAAFDSSKFRSDVVSAEVEAEFARLFPEANRIYTFFRDCASGGRQEVGADWLESEFPSFRSDEALDWLRNLRPRELSTT